MKKVVSKNIKNLKKEDGLEMLARLVVEGFEKVDKRFDGVDKRFEAVDKRFEGIDKRFESIDKRFDGIDKRFESLEAKVDSGFFSISHTLREHGERLDRIERKQLGTLENLDNTVQRSEFKQLVHRVDSLEKRASRSHK